MTVKDGPSAATADQRTSRPISIRASPAATTAARPVRIAVAGASTVEPNPSATAAQTDAIKTIIEPRSKEAASRGSRRLHWIHASPATQAQKSVEKAAASRRPAGPDPITAPIL